MSEPVSWSEDGTPHNDRFHDIYRTATGGLEQARQVFLHGCGLPEAWRSRPAQPHCTVLETGFGLGLNFLATWQAWREAEQRPRILHFVSVEAWPVGAADLLRSAQAWPELAPLAAQLARAWQGLGPGVHRLRFERGCVQLTLGIGEVQPMLRALVCEADAVYLDGFNPPGNPAMWSLDTLKAVARHCRRGTRVATWTWARAVRDHLQQLGFQVERAPGLPPKRDCLRAVFEPHWTLKRAPLPRATASDALVIGAGLSGAATAAQLALRGWSVQVVDAAQWPAAGASSLPAGLMVPHVSADDAILSRASRAGVRATLYAAQALLQQGVDWRPTPAVREGLVLDEAAWIKPAALVGAWLAQPGVRFTGGVSVARLRWQDGIWQALDAYGTVWASAPTVVLCTATGLQTLLQGLPGGASTPLALDTVAGQVAYGPWNDALQACGPAWPVSGHGHFVPRIHAEAGPFWLSGSTYERQPLAELDARQGLAANRERMERLVPQAAAALARQFEAHEVGLWQGERCTSRDRLPMTGPWQTPGQPPLPGLLVSGAMGSRGLSFAALCAEILVCGLHGEPQPVEAQLVAAMAASRKGLALAGRA